MKHDTSVEQYSAEETEQRLRKTLRAAFKMKPTPLKAIPRKPRAKRVKIATGKRAKD